MEQNVPAGPGEEESLKTIFDEAMKLYENIDKGDEATNSDSVQLAIKRTIAKFEKATNLVSLSGMFSKNESVEELPTDSLQYLLLPVLLGSLTLKLCSKQRRELIDVADIYFRDFLQRCNDYGITNVEPQFGLQQNSQRVASNEEKITKMVKSRESKIKRYKEMKELKEKLQNLKKAMDSPSVDDSDKRMYFLTLLQSFVQLSLDELESIENEKPILEYMSKHAVEPKAKERERPPPLKPVIITRDALQKAVYGAGYPSLPTMTVEEFYDKRVRDGTFPSGSTNIAHTTIDRTADENNDDEQERIRKENLVEDDDPEELARQRNMDEYKDDHRRGWGNRHNRS